MSIPNEEVIWQSPFQNYLIHIASWTNELWLQKIFEGSSKTRIEYCENKDGFFGTHTQKSQAPNSALSKQSGQVRCKAVLTIQRISPWRDQRAGKRSAARHGQHAHPPFPPSEERGTAQQWGCGPSPHTCKVAHEVGSLSTPSASGFDANDHQAAAFAYQEFVVLALLISTCACEDNAVRGGCPNARQSMGCECTSDRDVHSQLRSLVQRKSAGKNFDGPLIGCWHGNVHVTEFGVASDQCTRLTANARYSSLRSDSPCAQPTRSCARCPMSPLCVL